jgi:HD-like signal output (HDOD) protein
VTGDAALEKQCSKCARVFREVKDYVRFASAFNRDHRGNLWFQCDCGTQLALSPGRYDWFSPALFLKPPASDVFKVLAEKHELPHLPSAVLEVQRAVRDEATAPPAIAAALKGTPLIAADILKMANNLALAKGEKITSIEHAIVFVGRPTVAELARLAGLRSFRFRTKEFSPDGFWQEAMLTGTIAEHLARTRATHLNADEAYLAGAMANVGKIVAAICYPDSADKIHRLVTASKKLPNWRDAEQEVGAVDHQIFGEIGCVVWGLPRYVRDAAATHHTPPRKRPGRAPMLVDVVAMANQMTHWVLLAPNRIAQPVLDGAAQALSLAPAALETLAQELIQRHKAEKSLADQIDSWFKEAPRSA